MDQKHIPILEMLDGFQEKNPVSFHVPGHKNGRLFPEEFTHFFKNILQIDVTELPGLDDLHAPEGAIWKAERLASHFFQSDQTFFLVGGSTAGNLAMILAVCGPGDNVIVQRNCHQSIMNGLELAGANPIFLSPQYDEKVERFTSPSLETVTTALEKYPDAKALILTYPDYFGKTYEIKEMIMRAHQAGIPVLVDEAHGVHFSLGTPFPTSSLELGADVVVHSAHKTIPAMTMASYLHVKSALVSKEQVANRLQMIQSSSPSYPLMASLDIARAFLAMQTTTSLESIIKSTQKLTTSFAHSDYWRVISSDDPLKVTIQAKEGYSAKEIATLFETEGIYPELATDKQILFIHGLHRFTDWRKLKKTQQSVTEKLKNHTNHATIDIRKIFMNPIQELDLSYKDMQNFKEHLVPLEDSVGEIAAEAVTPYPPGIPFILKGEQITSSHLAAVETWSNQGVRIQKRQAGIRIFSKR